MTEAPDPSIAPNVDPDAPATEPAPARRVRYLGGDETHVAAVGRWLGGEAKHVAGWLADRLLQHPHFEPAGPPADMQPAEAESVPTPVADETIKATRAKKPSTDPGADAGN